jgi:hypothetical protein
MPIVNDKLAQSVKPDSSPLPDPSKETDSTRD